jgi:hypothetical protein
VKECTEERNVAQRQASTASARIAELEAELASAQSTGAVTAEPSEPVVAIAPVAFDPFAV